MTNNTPVYFFVLGLAFGYVIGLVNHVQVVPQW